MAFAALWGDVNMSEPRPASPSSLLLEDKRRAEMARLLAPTERPTARPTDNRLQQQQQQQQQRQEPQQENTSWDTDWTMPLVDLDKLPDAAMARQHSGWPATGPEPTARLPWTERRM